MSTSPRARRQSWRRRFAVSDKLLLLAAGLVGGMTVMILHTSQARSTEVHCKGNEKNQRIAEEMTEVLFNRRDAAQASRFYADTIMNHNVDAGGGGAAVPVPITAAQQMWRSLQQSMPDRKLTNDLIICADDLVVIRTEVTGTMTGPMDGMAPTGKSFSMTATDIYRFKDGKVVERWGNSDQIAMLKQLGVLSEVAKKAEQK